MKSLGRKTIREIDRRAIEELGIPGVTLMENAGTAVARKASEILQGRAITRCAFVCGTGNNGGDGFVAARHLSEKGTGSLFAAKSEPVPFSDLKVFVLGPFEKIGEDATIHLEKLRGLPIIVEPIRSPEPLQRFAAGGPLLWIDAIFGTGLARPVEGLARQTIELMNESGFPILAVDIPSGLDADTGAVLGVAVRATETVTFVRPKLGFEKNLGPSHCGEVTVAKIGIPEELIEKVAVGG